jgi:hypothetical protein
MFIIIILSYGIISFLDLKATYHSKDKKKLIIYFMLMAMSCGIGIASRYMKNMPSPAEPIQYIVFTLLGK